MSRKVANPQRGLFCNAKSENLASQSVHLDAQPPIRISIVASSCLKLQAAYINPLVYGNVAFIRRGGCDLVTKFSNAISKGVRAAATCARP